MLAFLVLLASAVIPVTHGWKGGKRQKNVFRNDCNVNYALESACVQECVCVVCFRVKFIIKHYNLLFKNCL